MFTAFIFCITLYIEPIKTLFTKDWKNKVFMLQDQLGAGVYVQMLKSESNLNALSKVNFDI